jgi:ABC-type phosphate transport system auxiliary subunit
MTAVITALIGMIGSAFGALVGVMMNSKMINYRLEQLEKKVQAHNNLVERMYRLEEKDVVHDEKISVINHRIADLERECSK